MIDVISAALILGGAAFYAAGSLALVRFPDLFSRLHAITKADNLGLGLLALGLALQADALSESLKLLLVWLTILPASAAAGHLIALWGLRHGDCTGPDRGEAAADEP